MMNFQPMTGLSNPHLQTLLPRFIRRNPLFSPHWQRLMTPDDDFVDLAWTEKPEQVGNKPLFILFHGLEGSFHSPYANGLLHAASQEGWLGVMMHFRGCSGEANKQPRAYHSGETSDARFFLEHLDELFPSNHKAAVGISLGGNMLANYLAQYNQEPILNKAAIISAPLDLAACSNRIQQGFSTVYQNYLLRSLKNNAIKKLPLLPTSLQLDKGKVSNIRSLYQFDDHITAPLHGFESADDYYQRCSGLQRLPDIKISTLVVHAQDDPFMTKAVIPTQQLPDNITYHLTNHGGHVGFVSGSCCNPTFWLERCLPYWFSQ